VSKVVIDAPLTSLPPMGFWFLFVSVHTWLFTEPTASAHVSREIAQSLLNRIESFACLFWSLQSIEIPRNVEILGPSSFSSCQSFSSISFESNSRLNRIESEAFSKSSLQSIKIPRNVRFIACNASRDPRQISLTNIHSCPEYARWQ
jgi:hypothetical protein